ncbi:MAG: hypothetical protein ACRDBF_02370, partial [Plesiomonas shigelloides]
VMSATKETQQTACKSQSKEMTEQILLAQLLKERSEINGSQFEEGTYEQGVFDALQWAAGMTSEPPYNADEFFDIRFICTIPDGPDGV